MELKVIGTGSAGNCYILETPNTALIIEAGVRFKEVKKALKFNISKIAGVIQSHVHKDHSKYIQEYIDMGIEVFLSVNDCVALGIDMSLHNVNTFNGMTNFLVGAFSIITIPLIHDVECYGFEIAKNGSRTVFLTDTKYCPYALSDVNNWIVECNHSFDILKDKIFKDEINISLLERIMDNHMSLETLLEMFSENDMSSATNIILIHGSDTNSHSERFKDAVIQSVGVITKVAENGLKMRLQ